jgi:hypothetical protein
MLHHMENGIRKEIEYLVACVNEFSHAADLTVSEAFRYLSIHGGIDFLIEHYEVEHLLSFNDVIDDLKNITGQAGGKIA